MKNDCCSPAFGRPLRLFCLAVLLAAAASTGFSAQSLPLPSRGVNAPGASALFAQLSSLSQDEREKAIVAQILSGNIPDFLRRFSEVTISNTVGSSTNRATFFALPDYLAIGSDLDFVYVPLSPSTAQQIADALNCSLPTRKMVDAIYSAAAIKLPPIPIAPGPQMTTFEMFARHSSLIYTQRQQLHAPTGLLTAGHKKDVVISAGLTNGSNVAIYGWHQTNGKPIQPLYLGHSAKWVDYSQCIRLVSNEVLVDGHTQLLSQALADPQKAKLFSDEGPFTNAARYTVQELSTAALDENTSGFHGFKSSPFWDEQVSSFLLAPGVRVHLNAPNEVALTKNPLLLVLYALPNGNSIEQTIGKHTSGTNDWHFEIQHIAAQTRFLRKQLPARSIVVAYLEAEGKSWPLWRKQHNDQTINQIVSTIRSIFPAEKTEIVLSGHSGGGSFTFGYLNSVESIPNEITRLAFLDSNYAYDREQHLEKISRWLKAKNDHSLCVLAYDDANALLNGKSFVSAAGGTWGKSHEMQKDLAATFEFSLQETPELEHYTALNGRVQFILRKNPDRKILHTVQVERNGFIHAMLSGTPLESVGYNYFGERAYTNYIRP